MVVLESCCGSQDAWTLADGTVVQPGDPGYWAEWARLTREATDRAGAEGARVMWVIPPPADGVKSKWYGDIRQRMLDVTDIEHRLADQQGIALVDWSVLANPDGTFTATLPDRDGNPITVRAADGVHFSPAGQALQARTTVDQVLAAWNRMGGRARRPGS